MKKWTKAVALIMALGLSSSFVGCFGGGSGDSEKESLITSGKEEIKMSFFIGEFGEWAKDIAVEWSNQNDKYYIKANSNMNLSGTIINDIRSGSAYDIFVSEDGDYQKILGDQYLEDLTDVFNAKPEGNKTIGEKMYTFDSLKGIYTKNDKVYVLPTNVSPVGLVFDYDRFAENGWLMLDDDGEITAGKDGVKGTYDDGQPQTWAEFKQMCEKIKQKTDDVFLYMGAVAADYIDNVGYAYLAQEMGEEKYKAFRDAQSYGTEVELADGTKTAFTIDEGYKAFQMKEVKDMFTFLSEYLTNRRYVTEETLDDLALTVDASHTKYITVADNSPAFIVEGNWFENGSKMLMDANVAYGGKPFGTYDYRYMLLPNDATEKNVVFSQTAGTVIVKKQADADKAAAIKDFLTYLYKDETMAKVSVDYGMCWALNYEMDEATSAKMTKFTKNTYTMLQDSENISTLVRFNESAIVPIRAYSSLGTYGLIYGMNGQTALFSILKNNNYNVDAAFKEVTDWNNASKWSGYVSQAKTFGYYTEN